MLFKQLVYEESIVQKNLLGNANYLYNYIMFVQKVSLEAF